MSGLRVSIVLAVLSAVAITAPGGEVTGPIEVQLGGPGTATTLTVTDEAENAIPGARAMLQGANGPGGDRVWIAADATVLRGVSIGDHSIVGTRSLVTRDVAAHTLAYGSPATARGSVGDRSGTS